MGDFTSIDRALFPIQILNDAFEFLREVGEEGYEGVVLLAGNTINNVYSIKQLYIPPQRAYKGPEGLMYHVDGEELLVLDDWLYENNLSLFAQIHTHPREAYHSLADDKKCIVTKTGGISIVVPDFAKDQVNSKIWAVYRLFRNFGWVELDDDQVNNLIELV